MNLFSLVPFATGVSMAAVGLACSRSQHSYTLDSDTYRYPPALGWLMVIFGFFFMSVAYWPGASPDGSYLTRFLETAPAWLTAFSTASYMFVYRVVVTADEIRVGAFRKISVPTSDMVDQYLPNGRQSKDLIVYLRSGKKIRFSRLLTDSQELWITLDLRIKRVSDGTPSPTKLHDQHLNNLNWKDLRWLAAGAVLLTIAVAIATYYFNRS